LQRLNDLVRLIACECESGSCAVYLHRPSQCLLRTARHAICLVQDDQLLPARWQGHFLLRKALYPVSHDVDTAFVGGIEFEDGFLCIVSPRYRRKSSND
jgi:hypothetical protein